MNAKGKRTGPLCPQEIYNGVSPAVDTTGLNKSAGETALTVLYTSMWEAAVIAGLPL